MTHQELLDRIRYNPETGFFIWPNGKLAGTSRKDGYRQIMVMGKCHLHHRLAWFYMTGEWPAKLIDHRNQIKNDNRWENLREATTCQNKQNARTPRHNTSGVKGVSWERQTRKWLAQLWVNRQHHRLGLYPTIEAAAQAVRNFREQHHVDFACHQ